MKGLKYFLYIIIQCTWGILQTLLGALLFLLNIRYEHSFYHGCIRTKWRKYGGVSLGLFIFVTDDEVVKICDRMSVHEYGHTIQSLILGPLYLVVVGITSSVWCMSPYFQKKREDNNLPYSSFCIEKWADLLGEKITGGRSLQGYFFNEL